MHSNLNHYQVPTSTRIYKHSKMHNKFLEQPSTYKYHVPDRFKGIYKGLDAQFWLGCQSNRKKKVNCFIEAAITVRRK